MDKLSPGDTVIFKSNNNETKDIVTALLDKYIDEYCDASTERGKKLREIICKELKLTTLGYQSIAGLVEAIGLPEDCICTYCWNGKG